MSSNLATCSSVNSFKSSPFFPLIRLFLLRDIDPHSCIGAQLNQPIPNVPPYPLENFPMLDRKIIDLLSHLLRIEPEETLPAPVPEDEIDAVIPGNQRREDPGDVPQRLAIDMGEPERRGDPGPDPLP
jgi:hypothetical protein